MPDPPQQTPQYVYVQHVGPPARPTNGLAIASMVLGIVNLCGVGSLLAVIFGHVALGQIKRDGSAGRGMAIAGLVLGYVVLGGAAVLLLAALIGGGESTT